MLVTIKDREYLSQVSGEQLKNYLELSGWSNRDDNYVMSTTREYTITIPTDVSCNSYPSKIAEILMILELVEKRSQLNIYVDITREGITIKPKKVQIKK